MKLYPNYHSYLKSQLQSPRESPSLSLLFSFSTQHSRPASVSFLSTPPRTIFSCLFSHLPLSASTHCHLHANMLFFTVKTILTLFPFSSSSSARASSSLHLQPLSAVLPPPSPPVVATSHSRLEPPPGHVNHLFQRLSSSDCSGAAAFVPQN